jgi:4-amino-4-deoxy-L-arabinose transferase-like glycosyltransferase
MSKKQIVFVFFILFIAVLFRLWQLGKIPVGMTDDEIREVYSAYSVWMTGKDITRGLRLPFTFILNNFSFSPIPIYITAPFVGLFGLSPFTARLPFALAGLGVVLLTYFLVKFLIKSQVASVAAGICMACNVWAIQISRMAHEAVFAQLFYLWGTYIFLNNRKQKSVIKVNFALFLFFLAFNSYDATKIILIPIVIALVIYKWKEIVMNKKILLIIGLWVVGIFSLFGFLFISQKAGIHGSTIFIFQNTADAAQAVELERRASDAPEILKIIYHNKLTYFADQVAHHYLYAFSPDFLFLSQEASGMFSLWSRGNLYLIELPLLIIGIFYGFLNYRKCFYLGCVMILIAVIPSGVGPAPFTYATRSNFMLPWLSVFISFGILSLVEQARNKFIRYSILTTISLIYLYFVSGYITQYYFEWSRYGAKYYSNAIKDVITLISSEKYLNRNILISNVNDTFILQYAFYNRINPAEIQSWFARNNPMLTFRSIHIIPSCLGKKDEDPRKSLNQNTLYITSPSCYLEIPDKIIYSPDHEQQWYIYENALN